MHINREDSHMIDAERDASPERFKRYKSGEEVERLGTVRSPTTSSSSSTSTSTTTATRSPTQRPTLRGPRSTTSGLSMMRTQPDEPQKTISRHPTHAARIETHRLQHQNTVGSSPSFKTKTDLPEFGDHKSYPPMLPDQEDYVVEFTGHDDPLHSQNWPMKKKLIISAILIFDSLAATLSSSIFSNAATPVGREFHVGREVTTLATSLFVLGYAFGPIMWAPVSELFGRRLPIIIAAFGFGIFNIAVATAKDLQTIMLCRFFSGIFGSCPLVVVAAVFSDIFDNERRGIAVAAFSATVFMGPLMGPFIGGFITTSYLGWRWTQYITAFMGFAACILTLFFQKESYPPIILVEKASALRRHTKNWGIHAKQDEVEVDLVELVKKNVSRPLRILFTEPIVFLVSLYMSFLYGLLYLLLTAYAMIFQQKYHMSPGVGGLPYFGFIIGEVIGFIVVVSMNPSYVRKLRANDNVPVPEWRLPVVMVGGVSFTIGLFWLGWTGYQGTIPWIVPTLSGLFSGFGIFTVFLQLLNYIIDAYLMFAASALAANTFMRSIFGAVFPLFATYMFDGIGIEWGMTLLGCVAALLVPMPFFFYFSGKRIRAKSKFAPAPDIEKDREEKDQNGGSDGDDEKV